MAKQVANAADAANNWASAMASPQASAKYQQGVSRVTVAPTAQAASADAQARYMQNTQRAVQSGHMAAKLNSVSLQQWQQAAQQKGAANLSRGASGAKPKVQAAMQKLQPVWQAMSDTVSNMPKGGLQNGLARITAALTVQAQMTGRQ